VTSGGGSSAGLMQAGDTLVFTFSESMDPASVLTGNTVTVTESRASGFNGTLAIPGLIVANAGIDRRHLGGTNSSGTATGTLVWSNSNKTLTLTLGTVTTTGSGLGTDGTIESIDPAPGLTDLAGNPILATSSASTRLF
jgi:hypothetical protein